MSASGQIATAERFWILFIQITATDVSSLQEMLVKWCSTSLMLGGGGNLCWVIGFWEPARNIMAEHDPSIICENTWRANISEPKCDSGVGCSWFWISEWIHHEVLEVWVSLSVGMRVVPVAIARKVDNVNQGVIENTIDKLWSIRRPPKSLIVFKDFLLTDPVRYSIVYNRIISRVCKLEIFRLCWMPEIVLYITAAQFKEVNCDLIFFCFFF